MTDLGRCPSCGEALAGEITACPACGAAAPPPPPPLDESPPPSGPAAGEPTEAIEAVPGAPTEAIEVVPGPPTGAPVALPPPTSPTPAPVAPRSPWVARVVGIVLAAGLGAGGFALAQGGGDDDPLEASSVTSEAPATTTTAEATTTTTAEVTTTTEATTTTVATTTTIDLLGGRGTPYRYEASPFESGLYCRDLVAAGASFADAMRYWYQEGGSERMDADANGVPCETVYPASDIEAWWSVSHPEVAVDNVARKLGDCGYVVTHVVATAEFPDGTHDVKVAVDADGDGTPDVLGLFNVYAGFEVFPIGDAEVGDGDSTALIRCRW